MSRVRAPIAVAPVDGRVDLTAARLTARTMATTIGEERRIAHAAEFAWAALCSYVSHKHPSLQLSGLHHEALSPLDEASQSLAERIGAETAALPLVEALHYLTSLYPAMMPQRRRSEVGAFYTPPALSERLLDLATEGGLDWGTAKVLDPAAGGGAFLVPAALRMLASAPGGEPTFVLAQLARRLSGLELDVHAAALAQASLEIVLAELIIASGRQAPAFVQVGDTLEAKPSETFDLVVGNPPYGRVALTPDQRERFKRGLYGHANLYGVFTDIAIRWCKPSGLIAFLTPTSMLGGHYFSALRGLLAKEAPPVAIDFVHARKGVFEDVLQETLLALYQRGQKARRVQVHYLHVTSETEAAITRNGTVGLPKDASLPWLAPRAPEHCKLIAQVEGMPCRLNTRESIRDDTIRYALIQNGAVIEREGLATTSPAGRYAVQAEFAALLDPGLDEATFLAKAEAWREKYLNKGALARIALNRQGAVASGERLLVTFPNGETRALSPGPSSDITKAVVEVFAPRFLAKPGVIWISESSNKVVARDDQLAKSIGLDIAMDKHLPDIVLVDLGPAHPLLVFIEVVATDGPVNEMRRAALLDIAGKAGFGEHVAFVTAYLDRSVSAFKRTVDGLAWGSYAWFAAEPEMIVEFAFQKSQLLTEDALAVSH